jgi:putative ATP-dependent endonuclease of the OLD family
MRVQNYRCVKDATLECEGFTSMVGPNGVGKSTFLRALELFYDLSPRITPDDFFAGDPSSELSVAITFRHLTPDAQALFAKYVRDDELTVERVVNVSSGKATARYHGATLRHPAFRPIRAGLEIKDRGKTARNAYDGIRSRAGYEILPEWKSLGDVLPALTAWEDANPAACVRERDDGQFFGFTEVAHGFLGRFTRLLFIPAVREASVDAAESRGSVLSALMDLVVRSALTNKAAYARLQGRSQLLYARLMNPANLTELKSLGDQLSSTLQSYVPDAGVALTWRPLEALQLPMPTADIKLIEGEYETAVDRTGHGLQRAFILTMLQQLSSVQSTPHEPQKGEQIAERPSLMLAIEEPELYQHPSRQRHLAKTLARLTKGGTAGVTQRTQVICATHSPLFVSVERIDGLRLLRRNPVGEGLPKATRVISTTIDRLAEIVWHADGESTPKYSAATLLPRMKTIMTPWLNEGFFADVVVLVEGEDDRAALLATAAVLGVDVDGKGIAVLPCGGKTCLDRPFAIFSELGIPTYVVWDGDKFDKTAKVADNHRLLRMVGRPVADWPAEVGPNFACFETDLESTMRAEIGDDVYEGCLVQSQRDFAIPKRSHALKNPTVVSTLIEGAKTAGRRSATLEQIVRNIEQLR